MFMDYLLGWLSDLAFQHAETPADLSRLTEYLDDLLVCRFGLGGCYRGLLRGLVDLLNEGWLIVGLMVNRAVNAIDRVT
jgi:hypothetical protein